MRQYARFPRPLYVMWQVKLAGLAHITSDIQGWHEVWTEPILWKYSWIFAINLYATGSEIQAVRLIFLQNSTKYAYTLKLLKGFSVYNLQKNVHQLHFVQLSCLLKFHKFCLIHPKHISFFVHTLIKKIRLFWYNPRHVII